MWQAAYEVVLEALLQDREIHLDPPVNEEDVGFVAETVADHLVGAFDLIPRGMKHP